MKTSQKYYLSQIFLKQFGDEILRKCLSFLHKKRKLVIFHSKKV